VYTVIKLIFFLVHQGLYLPSPRLQSSPHIILQQSNVTIETRFASHATPITHAHSHSTLQIAMIRYACIQCTLIC